jgi:hypothetical protein
VTRRTEPLSARRTVAAPSAPAYEVAPIDDVGPVVPPASLAAPARAGQRADAGRFQRLADGVRGLRVGGGTLNLGERTLMILGGIIAPVGFVLVILGWYGAAHTPNVYEQIPYMASGGFLGLGLVFLGAFFYFAHWMTEMVKESRGQSAAVVEAIGRLEETMRQQAGLDRLAATNGASHGAFAPPVADSDGDQRELLATNRGSMAHRSDCVVVAGKAGLRRVGRADDLEPCKLCDPYADD